MGDPPAPSGRPTVPAGGLPVRIEPSLRVTYSDGHSAEGNLILPDVPAPRDGWPLVLRVHSLGAHRGQALDWQQLLAGQGFAVWAYDVRGHLSAAGGGQTMWGGTEKYDLAEQIRAVAARYADVVDSARIAVIGQSQGGIHAWMAAAQSGRELTVAGRGRIRFPRISAAVASQFIADPQLQRVRDRTAFSSFTLELVADNAPLPYTLDPTFRAAYRDKFLAQDPAALVQFLGAQGGRPIAASLATSAVPILYNHAYHDGICSRLPSLPILESLPASTPWRAVSSTVGHDTPPNDHERDLLRQLTLRWLERFLWLERNEVEHEARVVAACLPLDPTRRGDRSSLWSHVHDDDSAANDYRDVGLRLTRDEALAPITTPVGQSAAVLRHEVAPGFTPAAYLATGTMRMTAGLLQQIPLSEQVYRTAPIAEEWQLGESPSLQLRLVPSAARFSVTALLSVRSPGAAEEVMLTSRGLTVLDAVPNQTRTLSLEMPAVTAILPAGSVVTLRLRNIWLREAPMPRRAEVAPLFTPFEVAVLHGDGTDGSTLHLPVRRRVTAQLVCDALSCPIAEPEALHLEVRGGFERRGQVYTILGSLSGHLPGTLLPGDTLPLNFDVMTQAILEMMGAPALIGFVGALDQEGNAPATFDLSMLPVIPPVLAGRRLSLAAWIFDDLRTLGGTASNPVDVVLR